MNDTKDTVTFNTSLTEGSIWRRMVAFAIPLFFGNLFQQLYNAADSLIVGNFLGSQALAAVSSTSSLIFLLVGFFNGIAIGAGVVIAHYYGAKETKRLRKAVHTTVAFGIICGLLLMVIGLLTVPSLLRWMRTPEDVLPNSILYFRIYFLGSLAFVLYNNFVGILQSVGDSKHPLYYLIFSSLLNIVLDIVLIGGFHFGVGAAAVATIISQFASALLCLYRLLFKCPKEYRLTPKELRLDPYAPSDHKERTSFRSAELYHLHCKCICSIQYQYIRQCGSRRLRFLFAYRGICIPAGHLFLYGTDYVYQPEFRCKKIRPREKGRTFRYLVRYYTC